MIESSMELTLVSIDNNYTGQLFPRANFDPKALAQTLRDRRLHLSYTEDSLAEALGLEPVAAYERLTRIADFADVAGPEWFSIGAGLDAIIAHELKFADEPSGPKFPHYTEAFRKQWFSGLLASRATFDRWHQCELAKIKKWFDPEGRLAKDQAVSVRGVSYEDLLKRIPNIRERVAALGVSEEKLEADYKQLLKRLATPAGAQDVVKEQIANLPKELATNWVLEKRLQDAALVERVARERERCPALVAEAGAVSLIRIGASLGVEEGWNPYGYLTPAKNDWADAFIIAQAAYANVLVSNDKGLRCRAELLRELKLFRPEVMRWDELLARPLS